MKILHLIPSYLPAYRASGPINTTHGLNKWLVKLGAAVTVYTTNADAYNETINVPLNTAVDIDGVKVFYFKTSFPRRWYYSNDLRKKLAATIKDFDVIHITSMFLAASTIGAYYARKFKKPYLISGYGSFMRAPLEQRAWFKKFYIAFLEKRNLAHAAGFHFASEKEKEEYLETKLPLKKALVIFSGIDPEIFEAKASPGVFRKRFQIPAEAKVILFLGRLYWIKGLDTLIPAFAEVVKTRSDARLVLMGYDQGGYEKEVRRLVKENKIEDKVIFTGPVFGEERNAAFSESDVFVLPSYTEAASIASLEALFFGLPIVITKNCGFAFEIGQAGAGLVVNKDKEELRNALLSVLNNNALAKEMSRCGKNFARQALTFDKIAAQFLAAYAEVVKNYNN